MRIDTKIISEIGFFFQEICRKQSYMQHFGRHWSCEVARKTNWNSIK